MQETEHCRLIASSVVIPALNELCDFQDRFMNSKAKYWTSKNFQEHVLKPAEKVDSLPEMLFLQHRAKKTIRDEVIMRELGITDRMLMTREEILWVILYLTGEQPDGEQGVLLNNNYLTLIGCMICEDGLMRPVGINFHKFDRKWSCHCHVRDVCYEGHDVLFPY